MKKKNIYILKKINDAKIFKTIVKNQLKKFKTRRKIEFEFENIEFENLFSNQNFDINVDVSKTLTLIIIFSNI